MSGKKFRLAFVGDVCLASAFRAQAGALSFPDWPAIRAAIGDHDFLVGNLECCLVDSRCSEEAKRQPMAVPAEAATFLRAIGFSDLCLANNHTPDGGPDAIKVTRERLSDLGMRAFGAGINLREAEATVMVNHNGRRVAFLGACDYSEYFANASSRAGVAPLKRARLGRRVRAAASEADLVVVTLHADLEFSEIPGRWRQRLSHWLIRQGAHLVIQHHPHVLQGVETYRGGIIAYSLGNFIFGLHGNHYQERQAGVFDSMVFVVDADLNGQQPKLTYEVIPVRIGDDHWPAHLTKTAMDAAIQTVQHLSDLTGDPTRHRQAWRRRCRTEASDRFFRIYYALRRGHVNRAAHDLWRLLAYPEDRRWMVGLLSFGYL